MDLSDCCSEEDELLSNVTFDSLGFESEDIESHGLGERSALADSDNITFSDSWECWWAMDWEVVVSLFESVVLLDVVQVISSDDDGSLHLSWNDNAPNYIIIINIYIIENKEACILKPLLRKLTYLKILPLMETFEVNGHFLSTYCPSIASAGVLKPIQCAVNYSFLRYFETYQDRSSCRIWHRMLSSLRGVFWS